MIEAEAGAHDAVASPLEINSVLRKRLVEAVIAQASINHAGLNENLRRHLGNDRGHSGALVAEPVIEGAASYETAEESLSSLSGRLLHPDLVSALTTGSADEDYRFDPDMHPYRHQIESWRHLLAADPKSVLVTSGTGSGKTECFLVPLLSALCTEAAEAHQRLTGVRAIVLYPLNALIASQQERLRRWMAPLRGTVRFGLYNGLTPEELRGAELKALAAHNPEQVFDRKTLRASPPPVLVTNVTMLEYLTIRREDRPLIENSKGKLRWIVIDEAHSYVGSTAAEISLLLRRVLHTFGVKAEEVRFIATSATIGGSDEASRVGLQRFLSDLAGVDPSNVHVVEGKRVQTALPERSRSNSLVAADLRDRGVLAANPSVQNFIKAAESSPLTLSDAANLLAPTQLNEIAVINAIADDRAQDPLLPLKVHQFGRSVPGLWSCLNPDCSGDRPAGWPFGTLCFERAEQCGCCKSPLLEVHSCRDCGEPFLAAYDHGDRVGPINGEAQDEFSEASDAEAEATDGEEGDEGISTNPLKRLIAGRAIGRMGTAALDLKTGILLDRVSTSQVSITQLDWTGSCPNCSASSKDDNDSPIRPFRFGAPFLIGNAAPVMLDGVKPMEQKDGLLPAQGRRLLSFTDSRQGTARFAANIETNSERAYARAYIYNMAQKSARPIEGHGSDLNKRREELDQLERLVSTNPVLADLARSKRAEYESLIVGDESGIPWKEACRRLAQDPIITHYMREVWESRDDRFKSDPETFGSFLLLRELARRPRRANSLETLGLARLRFEPIERVTFLPESLASRGRTIDEWRDFLYLLIDTPVRASFALDVSRDDVRWLLPKGFSRAIVGPGAEKGSRSDIAWPRARSGGVKSNAVCILEKFLDLDAGSGPDRAEINELLETAWTQLRSLFDNPGSTCALDLAKARIAPVKKAWRCPVTRRVLTRRAFGYSPYGHREKSSLAGQSPASLQFPSLPLTFPREASELREMAKWLDADPAVAALRKDGVWGNLHDRAAMLAPYLRAEEHSAQQPPSRLRLFEDEFKAGKINFLACSTTMEMGVDIGSISAVMMTNVPPSIANYRQRVGRAGRRKQGFSSSFTLARDSVLDRETFSKPADYLRRQLRPPQVKLDAPRIVQRHGNAFLLANWFSEASGELLRIKVGQFFGFSDALGVSPDPSSPVVSFCTWLEELGVRSRLEAGLKALAAGTALQDDLPGIFTATKNMFLLARAQFEQQWLGLRSEAEACPTGSPARKSVEIQLKRLCQETLLKELANRALLPGHGFPTSVIPFVNDCRMTRAQERVGSDNVSAFSRRYDYPSRNADIAIREYAPGAEVVIDGLVWRSAGVTLNWQRPAHQEDVREIQSLRHFWQCENCGAADITLGMTAHCLSCHGPVRSRQFLEPAGFRVDWNESAHADTDQVTFIKPEPPRIFARNAEWEPLLDPELGRCRSSHDGLVFFATAGASGRGYRICLECGRAEEEPEDHTNPLAEHRPLRGSRPGESRDCPGGERPFAVTNALELGHEVLTDVAEVQPANLPSAGGAWALVSAMREALARTLGIQPAELGMAVEARRNALSQATHSIFLFDRNSGGAGFSTRLFDDLPQLLNEVHTILDCKVPGCTRGCSACVITADLFAEQEHVDRKAALNCVTALLSGMRQPRSDDRASPYAVLSRPVADSLPRKMVRGDMVTIFADRAFDLTALGMEPFETLLSVCQQRKVGVRLALASRVFRDMDSAERLGMRDMSIRHQFSLYTSDPPAADNGAKLIALLNSVKGCEVWLTRDEEATAICEAWGTGRNHPVVSAVQADLPPMKAIPDEALLPGPTAKVLEIKQDKSRTLQEFGQWFATELERQLQPLGLWQPGLASSLFYSDRYVRSPLAAMLSLRALAGVRDALMGRTTRLPLQFFSSVNDRIGRAPINVFNDWVKPGDQADVLKVLAQGLGFEADVKLSALEHARRLQITYRSGEIATLFLDQGFGYWRTGSERFDFGASADRQAKALLASKLSVLGRGNTHITIMRSK